MSPSANDLTNCFPYPVPAPNISNLPSNVSWVGNPSTLELNNDTLLAQVNSQVIFNLLKGSLFLSKQSPPPNRVDLSLAQLLHQQCYSPIQPSEELVDLSQLERLSMDNDIPGILICPTPQKAFTKLIDDTLVINPGALVKGSQTGSYALLTVYQSSDAKTANKTRVEIRSLV